MVSFARCASVTVNADGFSVAAAAAASGLPAQPAAANATSAMHAAAGNAARAEKVAYSLGSSGGDVESGTPAARSRSDRAELAAASAICILAFRGEQCRAGGKHVER